MFKPEFNILPDGVRAGGLLPWIISVMMYLCALALFSAVSLQWGVSAWSDNIDRSFTIQVPADTAASDDFAENVSAALISVPGVDEVQVLSQSENTALLETWLGEGNVTADLPVPALIDVTITRGKSVTRDALAQALTGFQGAQVDTSATWLAQLKGTAVALIANAYFVLAVVVAATIAVVVFGTHAQLAAHKPTVLIVHHMGAEDQVIAREFQSSFLRLGFLGGLLGVGVALATLLLLSLSLGGGDEGLLAVLRGNWTAALLLLPLPGLSALLTMVTARTTVLYALKSVP